MPDHLDDLRNRVQEGPGDPDALHALGQEYIRQGRDEQASAHFKLALEIEPAYYPASISLAACHTRNRRPDEALTILLNAAEHATETGNTNALDALRAVIEALEKQ